jgi:hypothetical protein
MEEVLKIISKPIKNPAKVLGITQDRVDKIYRTFDNHPATTEPKLELRAIVYLMRNDANCSYGYISKWITDNRKDLLSPGRISLSKYRVYDIWIKALKDRGDERLHQYKLPDSLARRKKVKRAKVREKKVIDSRIQGKASRSALDALLK